MSTYDFFIKKIEEDIEKVNTLLQKTELVCEICGKKYTIKVNKKTYHPCCSLKCSHSLDIKDSKKSVQKEVLYLSMLHDGKITNKEIDSKLVERILHFYPSIEWLMESLDIEYIKLKARFSKTRSLSKAYKRSDIGDLFTRSSWEANIIRLMNRYKIDFKYEPTCFEFPIKKGTRFYLPDLYIPKTNEYWEIKGRMDVKSKTKISRFRKYYPELPLYIIDKDIYNKLYNIGYLMPFWEFSSLEDIKRYHIIKEITNGYNL
jgi:hypothetical protein